MSLMDKIPQVKRSLLSIDNILNQEIDLFQSKTPPQIILVNKQIKEGTADSQAISEELVC